MEGGGLAPTAGTTYAKQEQEPASESVTEVAPGVLRLQLPIQMPGLGHVNTYALTGGRRGITLVDPGMPDEASFQALLARLKAAGIAVSAVSTVVVTHSHPDHYGGVRRLMETSGAAMIAARGFGRLVFAAGVHSCGSEIDLTDTSSRKPLTALPCPWNGGELRPPIPRWKILAARLAGGRRLLGFAPPSPTRSVSDNEMIEMGGRLWRSVPTPGHTLDHLCVYDPDNGILLSGDHVLPTITPHVPGAGGGPDALSLFLASLDKVAAQGDVAVVLPAHGHPFGNMAARLEEIKAHHGARLQRLCDALSSQGPLSVEGLSHALFRPERWGPMAESEAFAHMEHLRLAGRVVSHVKSGVLVYELV